ncbi:hypothetical protein B0A48_17473 [Cryoendolithus antarcticus]|uniref:Uncharacterized protein n=1 Tax=Cryoendolithus antarcticus TaxID=1507870 RepID=A0A1V8SCX8_9PEZI|nr:hypothetical protein B0A48_17473 [Cryoendolithus antarcticus]
MSGMEEVYESPADSVLDGSSPGGGVVKPLVFVNVTYLGQKQVRSAKKASRLRVQHDETLVHHADWNPSLKFQHYNPHVKHTRSAWEGDGESPPAVRRRSLPAATLHSTRKSLDDSRPKVHAISRAASRRQSLQYASASPASSPLCRYATIAPVYQSPPTLQPAYEGRRSLDCSFVAPFTTAYSETSQRGSSPQRSPAHPPPWPATKKPLSKDPAKALASLVKSIAIDISNVLCYYHHLLGLSTTDPSLEPDLTRKWLSPLILSSPTLLTSITLLTQTHLLSLRSRPTTNPALLATRGTVLQHMLSQLSTQSSDGVSYGIMLSCVIMAAYEKFYGDEGGVEVHHVGLKGILGMRGGVLEKTGMERLMGTLGVEALVGVKGGGKG